MTTLWMEEPDPQAKVLGYVLRKTTEGRVGYSAGHYSDGGLIGFTDAGNKTFPIYVAPTHVEALHHKADCISRWSHLEGITDVLELTPELAKELGIDPAN